MGFLLEHAGHLIPLVGLGGWLGWARLARGRAARNGQPAPGASPTPGPGRGGTQPAPGKAVAGAVETGAGTAPGSGWATAPLDLSLDARLLLMACSVAAAVIHADVITSHFQVSVWYGWFFVLSALTQLAWGGLVVRRPDRALLLVGAIGNGLIVALWAVSRTTGLPTGPEPWQPESVGTFDVAATLLELVLVVGAVALLAGTTGARRSVPKYGSPRTSQMLANLRAQPATTENPAGRIGGLRRNADERPVALGRADRGRLGDRPNESGGVRPTVNLLLEYLPRGNILTDEEWHRRHSFLQWILFIHVPGLFVFGLVLHHDPPTVALALIPLLTCLLLGRVVPHRRVASLSISAGLVYSAVVLVAFSRGSIEAHFHFFIIVGFIALYQDWIPFLWNAAFTSLSHGVGSAINRDLIFNHQAGQNSPWVWSTIHGIAVLAACIGVVVFWKSNEDEQEKSLDLTRRLADAEITRRKFTSDMLVNLARRNQSLLYRQLNIINQLEEEEQNPDALAELFRLDHLATRIRRNAESLLVLSGEGPPRTWSEPVRLLDVVRAAIAETEDLDRVAFYLDERLAVMGHTVTDLTHLLAELVENAVRFSPPEASVIIRLHPYPAAPGTHVLTIEDCGIGMRREDLDAANELLAHPREVDLSVSQRLGLHVVARLAERHGCSVSLSTTPGSGVTAVVVLPAALFGDLPLDTQAPAVRQHVMQGGSVAAAGPAVAAPPAPAQRVTASHRNGDAARPSGGNGGFELPRTDFDIGDGEPWSGWWEPVLDDTQLQEREGGGAAGTSPAPSNGSARGSDGTAGNDSPSPMRRGNGHSRPDVEEVEEVEAMPLPAQPDGPQLNRRVPQSHLAPELRERSTVQQPPERAMPDGNRTREALSRYQASRRAARALVEGEEAGYDPDQPQRGGGAS